MTEFSVTFRAISLKAAADIQLGGLFEASSSVAGLGFYFDAIASNDVYIPVANVNFPYAIREGNGLRISLVAHGVDLKSTVSFGAVAAEARVEDVRVEYEVSGIGVNTDVIEAVMLLKSDLTLDLAAQLDEIVRDKLPAMLETSGLPARRYRVPLPPLASAVDPAVRARTVSYAMACIGGGRSQKKALEGMPDWALEPLVIATYARVVPGLKHDEAPKQVHQIKASTWLSTGEIA